MVSNWHVDERLFAIITQVQIDLYLYFAMV
jgi:hypothetical protein